MGCCKKSINIVAGSGGAASISTIYSADSTVLANRTVTLNGNSIAFNGTEDLLYTDAGRFRLTLYPSGLDDSATLPSNFIYSNGSGLFLSAPIRFGGLLPINPETSGTVSVEANHLTPINVSGAVSTVTPPSGATNVLFEICDSRSNAATNNITVNFSGVLFHGSASQTYIMNSNAAFARFRYIGSPIGWIVEK